MSSFKTITSLTNIKVVFQSLKDETNDNLEFQI